MATKNKASAAQIAARKKFAAAAKAGKLKKKAATKKKAAKKVVKKKAAPVKAARVKDKCAVSLGRKGGKTTYSRGVGIFKKRKGKKAASRKKK